MNVMLEDTGHEKLILSFVEDVLSSLSMRRYNDECEKYLASIFKCERVNMTLIDRFNKKLFRFKTDMRDPEKLAVESFTMDQGLAGYVAVSCHTL